MSITYIDIGTSCVPYTQPSVPSDIMNFYLSSMNGDVLNPKSRSATDSSSYTETPKGSLVSVMSSNYAFQARTTLSLLQRESNVKRYIQPQGTPTSSYEKVNFESMSSEWQNDSTVTYNGNTYYKKSSSVDIRNLIVNQYTYVSSYNTSSSQNSFVPNFSSAPIDGNLETYWLRGIAAPSTSGSALTSKKYLMYKNNFETLDVFSSDVTANDLSISGPNKNNVRYMLKIDSVPGPGYKLALYVFNFDNNSTVKIPENLYEIVYNPSNTPALCVNVFDSGYYIFDKETPQDESLPSQLILIRDNSENPRYLFVNTSTNPVSFSLSNYWASGLQPSVLASQTIFTWRDLTPFSNNKDIYHWKVSDKYVRYNGNTLVADNTEPSRDEGWVLAYPSGSSVGSLQYIRKNDVLSNVYVNSEGTLIFPTTANAKNSASEIFKCVQCTNTDQTTGLCSITS
jgi:hypothetical protein